jgi:polar amino acid transport system substrate-binding protein
MKFAAVLAFLFSLIAVGGVLYIEKHPPAATSAPVAKEESVYDRVMRTGTIRCAYASYPPFLSKDPNTGELSGIFYDLMEKLGSALDLKIDWTEEVPWATIIEGLETNRYDAFCADMWANASRARVIDFSIPFAYTPLNAYVRSDDSRFDSDLTAINQPDIRISTMDGEMGDIVARHQFPNAQRVPIPQNGGYSDLLLNVTSGKADIVFAEAGAVQQFSVENPGKLKNITPNHPIDLFPNVIAFRRGQSEFKAMLDTSMQQLINSGQIDELLKKYETTPGNYYRVAYPYRAEQ